MATYPYAQRKPAGMPILTYFVTVSIMLGSVLFFGVDILYPSDGLPVNTAEVSREPSKLERAIMEQKAEQQRDADRQVAELQKAENEREALRATVTPPPVYKLTPAKPKKLTQVERPHKRQPSAKSNKAHSDTASNAANSALGYAAEPPKRSFPPFAPFARSDVPY